MKKILLLGLALLAYNGIMSAQVLPDYMTLSINDADTLFMKHNVELLAKHYDIDIAKAQLVQSRLFDNPVISFAEGIYNRNDGKWFDFGNQSEQTADVEQQISIAGKRSHLIQLAKVNVMMAQYQYSEVVKTLYCEMNSQFVKLYYDEKRCHVYDQEITELERLVKSMNLQESKGNVSLMETSRLESELLSLRKEKSNILDQIIEDRQKLNVLLNMPAKTMIRPVINENILKALNINHIKYRMIDSTLVDRPDIQLADISVRASQINVGLQKSNAAPTLSTRIGFDRNGGICANYSYIGFSLSLPIFDRNQGNIKAAKHSLEQSNDERINAMMKAESELQTAYQQWMNAVDLYKSADTSIEDNFNKLLDGIISNFMKRNINMVEFLDYYESYKNTCLQLCDVREDVFLKMEMLNQNAGKIIFRY